jgi:hypothetical protein
MFFTYYFMCSLLFLGAVVNSTHLPLHVWLPYATIKCCKIYLNFSNVVLHFKASQCQTKYFMIEGHYHIGGI